VELSVADARAAGVDTGDEVRVSAGGESVIAVVAVRTGVAAGSVFLTGARLPHAEVAIEAAVAVR
jgi:anaerobic selenocysteine-containing dehydrogenase